MSLWNLFDKGLSFPSGSDRGERFAEWWGLRLARRHAAVVAPPDCRIHPDARIHPRSGAITFGRRCVIAPGAIVQGNVVFGDDCSVQSYAVLVGYGGIEDPAGRILVGHGVRIAPHAMLIAANHAFEAGRPIHGQGVRPAPITIEDDVWIAGRVTVTAGVTIGRGSVIGAGAVVTNDIPPFSVAVGVPAEVVKER